MDALIIQDLGFADLLKRYLPNMELHLSTQGTIYNMEGVKAAKKLNFSRAVLAREMNLDEIKSIVDENIMEVEVFIHGALCICYSGQCQMSMEIGGRSGNRGVCAQPCRLPYDIYGMTNSGKEPRLLSMKNFALSPKDLCTLD
ncbi:U32 family peptidase [Sinanaerobacter chloroacetimidivorans]|uniref:peptidase U32 family protein n=1 Tax=Sinanaerobacter chloroacetimidivorans TaxID=2818044 RepID=UPI0029CA19D4|nr:U32 family peptidase [Sinanaerobacter chloroacetimidivorans]